MKHLYIGNFSVKLLGLCKNHKIITPPQLRSPLPFDWRGAGYHCCLTWLPTPRREELRSLFRLPTPRKENFTSLFRLPTPRRGGVLARGAGCKNTATKQLIPTLGTLYSHVGNIFVKPHTEYEFLSPAEYGIFVSRRNGRYHRKGCARHAA